MDSSRCDSGSCVEKGGIFSRSCVVWHGGLSAVSFSNDGSRRRKTYVSDRRVSWDLAGMFGDWTWIFDCVSLVNLEDRKGVKSGLEERFFRLFRYVQTVRRTGQIEPYVRFEQMTDQEKIPLGACLAMGVFIYEIFVFLGSQMK